MFWSVLIKRKNPNNDLENDIGWTIQLEFICFLLVYNRYVYLSLKIWILFFYNINGIHINLVPIGRRSSFIFLFFVSKIGI